MHGILLLRLPADLADGAARLLLGVLLGAIATAVPRGPDPAGDGSRRRYLHAPILVRHEVPADGPVHPRIDRVGHGCHPHRIPRIPRRGARELLGKPRGAVHREGVREVLRRLVKAAALERTAGMRQVEPLAVIRVVAVRIVVVHRRLVGEDGLGTVLELLEAGPDAIEAGLERIGGAGQRAGPRDDAIQGRDGERILVHVDEQPAFVGPCRPRRDATLVAVPRRRRQQLGGGIEVGKDQVGHRIHAGGRVRIVGLPANIRLRGTRRDIGILVVVRNVAPHPPQLEVIVRPEKDGLAPDAIDVGIGDLTTRLLRADFGEQPQRRVGAHDAFVHARPLAIQVVLRLIAAPGVQLELGSLGLVGRLGALVGFIAGDAPERPIAGRAPPVAVRRIVAVERPVGGDQRALDAGLCRQRALVQRALRGRVEKVRAGVRDRGHRQEACRSDQHVETP